MKTLITFIFICSGFLFTSLTVNAFDKQSCKFTNLHGEARVCVEASYRKLQEDDTTTERKKYRGLGCSRKISSDEAESVSRMRSLCSKINSGAINVVSNRSSFAPGFNALTACSRFSCHSSSGTSTRTRRNSSSGSRPTR